MHDLQVNTFWDGIFHASTYVFVVRAWRCCGGTRTGTPWWSTRLLIGTMLIGFGAFNVVEGLIDHHLLGIHHVNETVPRDQWIYWDVGFLLWGALMWLRRLVAQAQR